MLLDVPTLLQQCAPTVSPVLMQSLIRTESAFNPLAIGVHAGEKQVKQPQTLADAVALAIDLDKRGIGFSVGLGQVSVGNIKAARIAWDQAFDPCANMAMSQTILWDFYRKAVKEGYQGVNAVWASLRGYNSGDVHKTVSNAYANKIFVYMNEKTPVVPPVTVATMGQQLPAVKAVSMEEWEGDAVADAQSREVFERDKGKEGF